MAKVQRKAGMRVDIRVNNPEGNKLGTFDITSGNLYYYRQNAKIVTKKYTWTNLMKLIEKDIASSP